MKFKKNIDISTSWRIYQKTYESIQGHR